VADAPVRIAVDGREMIGHTTGVGRYLLEILRCWRDDRRHEFSIVVPAEPSTALRTIGDRFQWIVEPAAVAGTRWEQWRLPRVLRRLRPDVLFAPAYTAPLLAPCPVVLTVHDVSFFAHPEWFGPRDGLRRRWLTRAAARRAARVVTVSEFSRAEIVRYLGLDASRVVVAPNGSPVLGTVTAATTGARAPLVLFVGSLFNRRRIEDMIRAFAVAAGDVPDARFVLIGDNRTSPRLDPRRLAAAAGVEDRVKWLEYADEALLNRMYDEARVFLFLSDYEGFAITPMEAAAHGVPAVLLDTPVSREIYGGAARLVSPNIDAIAAAIRELLTDSPAHATLLAAAQARLGHYSWQAAADRVLAALDEAAAR
jgi:glycosyltransferase involved in cell wall biosynthesis